MKYVNLFVITVLSVIFAACSSENPFSQTEDSLDEEYESAIENKIENRERNKSTSDRDDYDDYGYTKNSSSYRSSSSYRASSNSMNAEPLSEYDYLTSPMTMIFTLTHYRQIVCTMEGKGSKSCNYDDGDPRVSFEITLYQTNGDSTTYSTRDKLGKDWFYFDDIGEWDGEESFVVKVPSFTRTVRVCPHVEDDDFFGGHDRMYSDYCYSTYNIGQLDYQEIIFQSDSENEYCELEWEWYLY